MFVHGLSTIKSKEILWPSYESAQDIHETSMAHPQDIHDILSYLLLTPNSLIVLFSLVILDQKHQNVLKRAGKFINKVMS